MFANVVLTCTHTHAHMLNTHTCYHCKLVQPPGGNDWRIFCASTEQKTCMLAPQCILMINLISLLLFDDERLPDMISD